MRKASWLILGVALGFAAAHKVNSIPAGRDFFERVNAAGREFREAAIDGYRSREAELRGTGGDTTPVGGAIGGSGDSALAAAGLHVAGGGTDNAATGSGADGDASEGIAVRPT